MNTCVTAVILAAGSGNRMKLNITKQRIIIGNESVLHRTVKIFENCDAIDSVIVVVREDEMEFAKAELSEMSKVAAITVGGKTRVESAKIGFGLVDKSTEYVAIHDGARCFITENVIKAVLNDAKEYGAATASSTLTDTVKEIDKNSNVLKTVDRSKLMLVQTPQIFKAELYKKAIENIDITDPTLTDDNMLMERIGVTVHCTDTGKNNIKLTVPEDLLYAEFLLKGE